MEKEIQALFDEGYEPSEVYELGVFAALAYHLIFLVENDVHIPLENDVYESL